VLGAVFIGAGLMHFLKPEPYESIVPDALPAHRELVYASGVAEMLGGAGVLSSRAAPWAGWWLIATMLAVFRPTWPWPSTRSASARSRSRCCGPGCPIQALIIFWIWRVAVVGRRA
jgi:uncharacterized membrane protein